MCVMLGKVRVKVVTRQQKPCVHRVSVPLGAVSFDKMTTIRVLIVDGQTLLVLIARCKLTSLFAALRLRQNKKFKDHSNDRLAYIQRYTHRGIACQLAL